MPSLAPRSLPSQIDRSRQAGEGLASVACPDARPPAYRAVAGLAEAGMLGQFHTGFYYQGGRGVLSSIAGHSNRLRARLERRSDPEIPADRVVSAPSFDVALAFENRFPRARHAVARWRTRHFDRTLAASLLKERPEVALIFSDVGSEFTLPACLRSGIRSVLSVVHGDVLEERALIARERERSPEFFPIYLGDGPIDEAELSWLHDRRLQERELADRILVPSEQIAKRMEEAGTPADRVNIVPYAADLRKFRPLRSKRHTEACTFLFAGGITQRKGIKYLLEAWRLARRPGWKLQLLGALPADPAPLAPYRDEVEWLGRVGHAEMPEIMARADVFVFPSLFEGSAVVTYEALASGLPTIVTPNAGSVVRDGIEGFLVEPAAIESLAERIDRLGRDPGLRESMSIAARLRAEAFDWSRYQASVLSALFDPTAA